MLSILRSLSLFVEERDMCSKNQSHSKEVEIIPNFFMVDVLVLLPVSMFHSEHLLQFIIMYLGKFFIHCLSYPKP